jgi:hypothetical protein
MIRFTINGQETTALSRDVFAPLRRGLAEPKQRHDQQADQNDVNQLPRGGSLSR